jgi:hypothetical protein
MSVQILFGDEKMAETSKYSWRKIYFGHNKIIGSVDFACFARTKDILILGQKEKCISILNTVSTLNPP